MDNCVKRWPIIILFFGSIGWITKMQLSQDALASVQNKQAETIQNLTISQNNSNLNLSLINNKMEYMQRDITEIRDFLRKIETEQ